MKAHILERLTGLAPVINEICAIGGVPGLSLGVALHGKVVHTANFGHRDVEASIPPDADTQYGIASITKIFTASAVGSLVSEGKLQWTTPVVDILPDLNSTDPILTQQLTILDLLTHRTGLAKSNHWWYGSDGVMLLEKSQTVSAFNALKQMGSFRAKFDYTNWGYALIGEVIEKLSGMSFGDYLQSRIFEPLQLERTTLTGNYTTLENFAKPYAALDDASFYPLPPPAVQDGTIMVSAQGVRSSVNDLLKFSGALMQARKGESSPLKYTAKQFSGHMFRNDAFLEKSYGLGLMKNQLPTTIGGGANSQFAKLPIITPGGDARHVVSHGGSQAGYTSFLTMLPEIGISFTVLTNSIGLADPTGWVNELLLETLVESPGHIDFVKLAKDAAKAQVSKYPDIEKQLEEKRVRNTTFKALDEYTGRYINAANNFVVEIRSKDATILQVAFQGLDSQVWDLRHYEYDTFLWLTSRDEMVKRARFPYSGAGVFKIIFTSSEGQINGLCWPHEPGVPNEEQWFSKSTTRDSTEKESQKPIKAIL